MYSRPDRHIRSNRLKKVFRKMAFSSPKVLSAIATTPLRTQKAYWPLLSDFVRMAWTLGSTNSRMVLLKKAGLGGCLTVWIGRKFARIKMSLDCGFLENRRLGSSFFPRHRSTLALSGRDPGSAGDVGCQRGIKW